MDLSYLNFNRMVMNETRSIRFENLDILSTILNCPVGDLFEKTENPDEMEPVKKTWTDVPEISWYIRLFNPRITVFVIHLFLSNFGK